MGWFCGTAWILSCIPWHENNHLLDHSLRYLLAVFACCHNLIYFCFFFSCLRVLGEPCSSAVKSLGRQSMAL